MSPSASNALPIAPAIAADGASAPDPFSPPPLSRWDGFLLRCFSPRVRRSIAFLRTTRQVPRFRKPRTYLQKMNWRILYYRNPEHAWVSDRLEARRRVAAIAPELLLAETLWTGTDITELAAVDLPERWVLKANNRSGAVYLGQGAADTAELAKITRHWLFGVEARFKSEWTYGHARACFTVEEWIGAADGTAPMELNLTVINGRVHNITVIRGRFGDYSACRYDRDWTFTRGFGALATDHQIPRPANLDTLVAAAETLATGFDVLRVDLMASERGTYFGELTYYPGGGLSPISRAEDRRMGALWTLPNPMPAPEWPMHETAPVG